jgi:NitT/TauT family transport system permease protein
MTLLSPSLESSAEHTARSRHSRRSHLSLWRVALAVAAGAAWCLVAAVTLLWPDLGDWGYGQEFGLASLGLGILLVVAALAASWVGPVATRLTKFTPWLFVLGLVVALWQALTAKTGILPMPFFPPPHALVEVFMDDRSRLVESIVASLRLLVFGAAIGAAVGFVTGVALGWSRIAGYWIQPVLRLVGPLPATAWLPISFILFPSSWSASIFLIALAVGFPVTILTWSGVAGVNSAFYDVARTLGANQRFLILKVAIPAALPQVFVGLFMGLGASFAVLVTAEMMGVKAGLGFYLQWAQGWAAYANMYAALIVMALMCSGLITLLFKVRDRVLSYQKGQMKW